jgi:[NiFe] hydrogenase diaphorase moiety large subunit
VGNTLLRQKLVQILEGHGEPADIEYLNDLGNTVKTTSRCGLGQTSPNPVLTTIKNFRSAYNALLKERPDGMQASFDLRAAVRDAEKLAGRRSVHAEE